jgi:hypothetical protein
MFYFCYTYLSTWIQFKKKNRKFVRVQRQRKTSPQPQNDRAAERHTPLQPQKTTTQQATPAAVNSRATRHYSNSKQLRDTRHYSHSKQLRDTRHYSHSKQLRDTPLQQQ